MNIPKRDDITKLMAKYYEDVKQIQKITDEIEFNQLDLDSIINRQVYNLENDDIETINNFLEIW